MDDTTPPLGAPAPGGTGETSPPDAPRPSTGALTDIRRTEDGRVVAGVCAGIGRHLGIDPVIPRIIFAVLTVVGFGGVLAYAAAWILLPDEQTGESYLKRWLGLGDNEPQIRLVGLGAAALIALTWQWGWGWGWALGPLWFAAVAVVAWVALREYRERSRRNAAPVVPPAPPSPQAPPHAATSPYGQPLAAQGPPTRTYAPVPPAPPRPPSPPVVPPPVPAPRPPKPPNPRHDGGLLTILTLSVALIATGVMIIATDGDLHSSVYVAVATGTLALGMLVGTMYGNARPLIFPALVAVAVLAVSVVVPRWDAGRVEATPSTASGVRAAYGIGFGEVVVDLTGVTDPQALDGRRIQIENGVGTVRVIVPPSLDIDLDANVGAGAVLAFGSERGGLRTHVARHVDTARPDLTLDIDVRLGTVEVTRS
ncbi:PspC domain-containing protein [Mumia quercus]|uniref:PspC domain-containing protein n=1 Tax=Mumia quercus TaxID=2976125 RepID=UPI0021CEDF5A|nr:PspC domain-containing protein [Mumia quercus]